MRGRVVAALTQGLRVAMMGLGWSRRGDDGEKVTVQETASRPHCSLPPQRQRSSRAALGARPGPARALSHQAYRRPSPRPASRIKSAGSTGMWCCFWPRCEEAGTKRRPASPTPTTSRESVHPRASIITPRSPLARAAHPLRGRPLPAHALSHITLHTRSPEKQTCRAPSRTKADPPGSTTPATTTSPFQQPRQATAASSAAFSPTGRTRGRMDADDFDAWQKVVTATGRR